MRERFPWKRGASRCHQVMTPDGCATPFLRKVVPVDDGASCPALENKTPNPKLKTLDMYPYLYKVAPVSDRAPPPALKAVLAIRDQRAAPPAGAGANMSF